MKYLKDEVVHKIVFAILLMFLLPPGNYFPNNLPMEGDDYLAFAEEMPQPVGGLKAIYQNITYPDIARKAGVEGKVYLLVFIEDNGSVKDVKIIRGIGAGCDDAAIEAVKKVKFTPGKNKGKAVKVKLSLAIQFKLT